MGSRIASEAKACDANTENPKGPSCTQSYPKDPAVLKYYAIANSLQKVRANSRQMTSQKLNEEHAILRRFMAVVVSSAFKNSLRHRNRKSQKLLRLWLSGG